MAPLEPAECRDLVIESLKRALHGPSDLASTMWPGSRQAPTVVVADQVFADWNDPALNQGLVDESGQEVLRYNPYGVYGVGILFPELTTAQEDGITAAQDLEDQVEEDLVAPTDIPEFVDTAGPAEETLQVSEYVTRPRSIAVSFRIPVSVARIAVELSGGRYTQLPVVIDRSPMDLWRRTSVQVGKSFDTDRNSSHTAEIESLTLQLGVESRPLDKESILLTVYAVNLSTCESDPSLVSLFQSALKVKAIDLLPYPERTSANAEEDSSFRLLYRSHPVYAIGHGCDASAAQVGASWEISSECFPTVRLPAMTPDVSGPDGLPYAVGMRDLAKMTPAGRAGINRIIGDYTDWIDRKCEELAELKDDALRQAGTQHLDNCTSFRDDIVEGWRLVETDPKVAECFQWTSLVMDDQRFASGVAPRDVTVSRHKDGNIVEVEGSNPHSGGDRSSQGFWRPFQIAFILASLAATVDESHPRRADVDIIWMPTGGGKTEAYLGLAAFTMLWHRARMVEEGQPLKATTLVLMRYTLRLLTAQQVQRAAALMCAMEVLRRRMPAILGDRPLRIGAFLGQAATPNTRKAAIELWNELNRGPGSRSDRGFLLTRCPWCGARLGAVDGAMVGYRKVPLAGGDQRVLTACPAQDCEFRFTGNLQDPGGLPVLEVDEDIYLQPPAFVVGTIDKFAMLTWKSHARTLFGLGVEAGRVVRRRRPPALFIQDELHLISGPLGSLDGLYEVALEELCTFDGGSRPRIVAATATTRNFRQQILRLYGRTNARLLPPPGLEVNDSFFARVDPDRPGRVHVGVCAPGYGANAKAQLRVLGALAHAAGSLDVAGSDADPWWTNLSFFSSRRSLGLALSTIQTGLDNAMFALAQVSGMRVGRTTEQGTRLARRSVSRVKELTATSRDNVNELLAQLGVPKSQTGCIDLCFATSMIEVGVDVPRLGLMTVMGQPKSFSQYIQVSGRVGRTDVAPGIVVVVLSPSNVRDRSHFETFTATHNRLYASVESTSVTPFTPQALMRGLAGSLAAVLRATHPTEDPTHLLRPDYLHQALSPWRRRAITTGGEAWGRCVDEREAVLVRQSRVAVEGNSHLDWDAFDPKAVHPFLIPLGAETSGDVAGRWAAPMSMRSVDAEAGVVIPRGISPASSRPESSAREVELEDF